MGVIINLQNITKYKTLPIFYSELDLYQFVVKNFKGLNGDILVWNPVMETSLELSSMGIRVDKEALLHQLAITGTEERKNLYWHQRLLNDELPLSVGGGIGQSRLCMYFLRKAHIGEIQSSIWPDEMKAICKENKIELI